MRIRWILIIGLGLVGAVWIGQGLGLIRGSSFMTDDVLWAIFGAALLVAAVALGLNELRRSRSHP